MSNTPTSLRYRTIRRYDDYISAHIALGQLTEEQISCWLKDENTVTVDPAITYAVGGIKLMVAETQADRALQILRISENNLKGLAPCPACGSMNFDKISSSVGFRDSIRRFFTGKQRLPQYQCVDCGEKFAGPATD